MEQDARQTLIAVCETLKAEYHYLTSLQGRLVWLEKAVRQAVPAVANSKETVPFEAHPETVEQIRLIDLLLEKLQKS